MYSSIRACNTLYLRVQAQFPKFARYPSTMTRDIWPNDKHEKIMFCRIPKSKIINYCSIMYKVLDVLCHHYAKIHVMHNIVHVMMTKYINIGRIGLKKKHYFF